MSRVDVGKEPYDRTDSGNEYARYPPVIVEPTHQHDWDQVKKGESNFRTGDVVQIANDERQEIDGQVDCEMHELLAHGTA